MSWAEVKKAQIPERFLVEPLLDRLPDDVTEKIFRMLPAKAPEQLRATCKRLNNVFLGIEGSLPLPESVSGKLGLFGLFPEDGLVLRFDKNRYRDEYSTCCKNATYQKVLKYMRMSSKLIFEMLFDWPDNVEFFLKSEQPKKFNELAEVMKRMEHPAALIRTPVRTTPDVLLFLKETEVNFAISWYPSTWCLKNLPDGELMKRIHHIYAMQFTTTKENFERIMDNDPKRLTVRLTLEEEIDMQPYYNQWTAGERSFRDCQLKFPTNPNSPYSPRPEVTIFKAGTRTLTIEASTEDNFTVLRIYEA